MEKDVRMHLELEKELAEKSREELLATHKKNMDDLDRLFANLQSSLKGAETTQKTEIVTDAQALMKLSEEIDKSLAAVDEVSRSQEISTFQRVAELSQTQKTDTQRAAMQEQVLKTRLEGQFNPFASKIDLDEGHHNESPHESDNELERD